MSRKGNRFSFEPFLASSQMDINLIVKTPIDSSGISSEEKSCIKQAESTDLDNQTATDVFCQLLRQQAAWK